VADVHPLTLAYARDFPAEMAAYLAAQGVDTVNRTLIGLPEDTAAGVVARLPHAHLVRLLADQADEQVSRWLDAADADQALAMLLHMEEDRRNRLLAGLSSRRMRRTLTRLVVYPRETVGALVNPAAASLDVSMPLGEAVALLRQDTPAPEQPIWLTDPAGIYLGLLDLNRALVAHSDQISLESFVIPVNALRAELSLLDARGAEAWAAHSELPVIDHLNHLLGTVSHARLEAALGGEHLTQYGLADSAGELTRQYFRVMGAFMGDLLGHGRPGK